MPVSLAAALAPLHSRCGSAIVVTTMAPAREWLRLGPRAWDLVYAPSSMGQAPAVGLGLALAQPARRVVVCNGDGSQLMNLGALVTVTAQAPPNLAIVVFDNGCYEVTGRQLTAASDRPAGTGPVDFVEIARGCGFRHAADCEDLPAWEAALEPLLTAPGPVFVRLAVEPEPGALVPRPAIPARERARALRAALAGGAP